MIDSNITRVQRKGDWQQTFTGLQFWTLDPRPEEVAAEDIAHALALQCRFAGHCRVPYSVAEHSSRVADVVWHATNGDREVTLAALLHDASEAYCVDVPRPLKPYLDGYRDIERRVMIAVMLRFGLPVDLWQHPEVKRADEILLMTEARDLMGTPPAPWTFAHGAEETPRHEIIVPWSWQDAEASFLRELARLTDVDL